MARETFLAARNPRRNRFAIAVVIAVAIGGSTTPGLAQEWRDYPRFDGCVGGRDCSPYPIEIELEARPILRIRFLGSLVGSYSSGLLRVTLDGRPLGHEVTLERRARVVEMEGRGQQARWLRFEAAGREAVEVSAVEVLYGRSRDPSFDPYDTRGSAGAPPYPSPERAPDGWAAYRNERGCIGGDLCPSKTLNILLEDLPIERLSFFAHADYGQRSRGVLKVWIDDRVLVRGQAIDQDRRPLEVEVGGRRGEYLVFEALTNNGIMVDDILVLYQENRRPDLAPPYRPEPVPRDSTYRGPGVCLGGDLCRDRRELDIRLDGLPVEAIRFFAHSDVGRHAEGALRVFLDEKALREDLAVPRQGDLYTITIDPVGAQRLTFEAIGRDEVVVEGIDIRYQGQSWTRHRAERSRH